MTNRDPCAESTETSPPQVLSLPRTGGREAMYLPHGFVQSADTRAGDASSPAHSSFSGRLSSLEGAAIVNLAHNGARPASRDSQAGAALPCLQISPGDVARRQSASWGPLGGEIVQVTQQALFEPRFCAPSHLLIAAERGERHEGESFVEGAAPLDAAQHCPRAKPKPEPSEAALLEITHVFHAERRLERTA
jgi:hypothetical protein